MEGKWRKLLFCPLTDLHAVPHLHPRVQQGRAAALAVVIHNLGAVTQLGCVEAHLVSPRGARIEGHVLAVRPQILYPLVDFCHAVVRAVPDPLQVVDCYASKARVQSVKLVALLLVLGDVLHLSLHLLPLPQVEVLASNPLSGVCLLVLPPVVLRSVDGTRPVRISVPVDSRGELAVGADHGPGRALPPHPSDAAQRIQDPLVVKPVDIHVHGDHVVVLVVEE
mmetsp:Transcript_10901/g.27491  ORF Transcript_10901/g.27491 Transcript_10901/m.27491 type:complete len:223 (+) Transcript_10901:1765-2433(+)